MADLNTSVDLLLATMDLKLVQSVIGAMRAADKGAAAAATSCCGVPCPTPSKGVIEPRFRHEPDVFIKSRPVVEPTPKFLPRVVYHPSRIETKPAPAPIVIEVKPECDSDCTTKCSCSPLPPPWKKPLCEKASQPALKVKIVKQRPDVIHKGSLIDMFL